MTFLDELSNDISRIRKLITQVEVKGESNLIALVLAIQTCDRISGTLNQLSQNQNGSDVNVQAQQSES